MGSSNYLPNTTSFDVDKYTIPEIKENIFKCFEFVMPLVYRGVCVQQWTFKSC